MELNDIVPEYRSKNIIVRKIFFGRLNTAVDLGRDALSATDASVLDLGCGEGVLIKKIEETHPNIKVFGSDIEPNIELLKKSVKAEISVADINDLPYPDKQFNAIFCLDVLEHIRDLQKPAIEIARILKDEGVLIISEPTESAIYKFGRWILKGTFSAIEGPAASPHWHNAKTIENFMTNHGFELDIKRKIPNLPFFSLFHIMRFKKNRQGDGIG